MVPQATAFPSPHEPAPRSSQDIQDALIGLVERGSANALGGKRDPEARRDLLEDWQCLSSPVFPPISTTMRSRDASPHGVCGILFFVRHRGRRATFESFQLSVRLCPRDSSETMMTKVEYSRWQQFFNLVRVTKYGILVGTALFYVPLTAYPDVWLHDFLGNMFHDLHGVDIYFLTVAMCGAAWSLVFTQGLMVQGLPIRHRLDALSDSEQQLLVGDFISRRIQKLLTVPLTRGQLALVAFFSASGLFVINWFAFGSRTASFAITLLGVVTSLVIVVVPVILVRLAFPSYAPLAFLSGEHKATFWSVVEKLGRLPVVRQLKGLTRWSLKKGRRLFARMSGRFCMRYLVRCRYLANHFLATLAALTLAGILVVVGLGFAPGDSWEASPAFYLYILLMLVIWVFSFLDFHLSRRHVSPLLVLVALFVAGDWIYGRDHYFDVEALSPAPEALRARAGDEENLIVVSSTGGGITAAGWTTWALKELIEERPDARHELGLVSAISGGSVGTAFFIDGLARCKWQTERRAEDLHSDDALCLETIYERSVASSLGSIVFGLAYADFWRIVTGGLAPLRDVDRGTYLEDNWRRIAAAELVEKDGERKLALNHERHRRPVMSLSHEIATNVLPDFILSTAAMESGRRLMITPIAFETPCLYRFPEADVGSFPPGRHGKERGCTLTEYLDAPTPIDLDLWTAARLSATFPWVSPAARAKLDLGGNRSRHHLVDGGYYDNYGVASALDWLEAVLQADKDERKIRRVAFIELRASATTPPAEKKPQSGSFAALFGPLLGLLEVWEASALERNRIETDRFLSKWAELSEKTATDEQTGIHIRRFVFETSDGGELPLSWKLSIDEKQKLEKEWQRKPVQRQLAELNAFLEGS